MGEALDIVRRHYDAFRAEDYEAFLALYDPDVEVDLCRSGIPDGGVHHGHDGLRAAEILTVRDGLIVHFVIFLHRDDALREAGLR
jgi:ketosteroid isomerase-like protein